MKILLVNTYYYPEIYGGAEYSVKKLAEELKQQGHTVKVLCTGSEQMLPSHSSHARFGGKAGTVVKIIFVPFIYRRRSCAYKAHVTSLCQLRNNFFSKISHKAQYYQLTLKISTKKEPLISQKSQTLRFYLYSISPNCTILA